MAERNQVSGTSDNAGSASSSPSVDDWPAKATLAITQYVESVRGKTTGPALVASRTAVYGIPIALVALIPLFLLTVVAYRFLIIVTGYAPGVAEGETWLANFALGTIFLVLMKICWGKKEK